MGGKPTGDSDMFSTSKRIEKEREKYIRDLTRQLLTEARPAHRQGWGISHLLAAYRIGQALNELGTQWWWDLEIHEIDLLFPWDENAVNALANDMQRNGYREDCPPIMLFEHQVLDGKLRLEAARRADVTPRFEFFDGDVREALRYALRLNGSRQSVSGPQRAVIVEDARVR